MHSHADSKTASEVVRAGLCVQTNSESNCEWRLRQESWIGKVPLCSNEHMLLFRGRTELAVLSRMKLCEFYNA